ncbi:hypothetical protein BS47DRAFT_356676 [Hydnum rufescens UP504]|uniref:Uncharacterized protein n=1 Tax=Hydnum rufescens UP504 TaxID=1448309 RepID=A0A9P6AJL1_9AGAM|nr:hypothetical protein BS47DRAFT_356676 [Hydnum rufescens UP504]
MPHSATLPAIFDVYPLLPFHHRPRLLVPVCHGHLYPKRIQRNSRTNWILNRQNKASILSHDLLITGQCEHLERRGSPTSFHTSSDSLSVVRRTSILGYIQ